MLVCTSTEPLTAWNYLVCVKIMVIFSIGELYQNLWSGDCVIIGNTDGGIYVVDSSGFIGHITQHAAEVTDFALFSFSSIRPEDLITAWFTEHFFPSGDIDHKNRLRAKHEFIVSTSQDSNIQINKIPLRFCSHKCNVSAKSKIVLENHDAATLMIR